jgi:hypothetical protein
MASWYYHDGSLLVVAAECLLKRCHQVESWVLNESGHEPLMC